MSWQDFVFEPAQYQRLERMAQKRFPGRESLAEEAFTWALERLTEDGWARLGAFAERRSPWAYLATVFRNLLEDFSRARFGRPRPPAWLKRLGSLWVRVYKRLCLERQEPERIVAVLGAEEGEDAAETAREAISVIYGHIPDCGMSASEDPVDPASGRLDAASGADEDATPEERLSEVQHGELIGALRTLIAPGKGALPSSVRLRRSSALAERWPALRAALDLSDEDRIILRLAFQEGRTDARIALLLGLEEHNVRYRRKRAVQEIRGAFAEAGFTAEALFGEEPS